MASELLAVGSIPLDTADDTAPASPDASGVESWRPLGMRDQWPWAGAPRPSLTAEDNQSPHNIIDIILSDHLGAVERCMRCRHDEDVPKVLPLRQGAI